MIIRGGHPAEVLVFSLVNEILRTKAWHKKAVCSLIELTPTRLSKHFSGIDFILGMPTLGIHFSAFTHKALVVLSLGFINDNLTTTL